MSRPTIWQQNAHRFATRPEDREEQVGHQRARGVAHALQLVLAGSADVAAETLQRSFWTQVRMLGLGYAAVPGKPYEEGGHATPPAFTCPVCGTSSWNPNDAAHGYCGRCHAHTGRPSGLDIPADTAGVSRSTAGRHRRTA